MKTLTILKHQNFIAPTPSAVLFIALSIGYSIAIPYLFSGNETGGFVDAGIWQLLLIALITWAITLWLCLVALNWMLEHLGLPELSVLVLHFDNLTSWQKLKSYFLLFVSLLGSIGLTLTAVV